MGGKRTFPRYSAVMARLLNRFPLLRLLLPGIWWVGFAVVMLSPWPAFIDLVSAWLGVDGSSLKSIIHWVVFPVWFVLTGLLIVLHLVSRQNRSDRSSAAPREDVEHHKPYWVAMTLVAVAAIGLLVFTAVSAERVAQKCEDYAQQHRILANQVIECPF